MDDKECFAKHEEDCANKKSCRIILPNPTKEDDRFIEFKNFKNKEYVGLVIYADTEAILKPRREDQDERVLNNHQAVSIGYYAKFHYNIAPSRYAYYGQKNVNEKSPVQWFAEQLMELAYIMKE